jgi:hypothetical protein
MRLRPKALMRTRAWLPVGVGLGVEVLMYREEMGPLPPLMSTARMVLVVDIFAVSWNRGFVEEVLKIQRDVGVFVLQFIENDIYYFFVVTVIGNEILRVGFVQKLFMRIGK